MQRGDIKVICNVALYQEGLDVPDVSCIVFARPTKSIGLYRQCGGRGLRPSPGKDDCMIMDHGGVIEGNGFLEDEIGWCLDGKEKGYEKKKPEKKDPRPLKCTICNYVFQDEIDNTDSCPQCGSPVKKYGKKIETTDDELNELKPGKFSMEDKRRFYGMALNWANSSGYKKGWVAHKYKEKFKVWPKGMENVGEIFPDAVFNQWMKYQRIKYFKQKEKREKSIVNQPDLISNLYTNRGLWGEI